MLIRAERIRFGAILTTALLAACATDRRPLEPVPPTIETASVAANANNVLSAIVSTRVQGADSVAVRFRLAGVAGVDSVTPAIVPGTDDATIPVLGLLPERRYVFHVIAYGAAAALGDSLDLRTGALPIDLPAYSASGDAPGTGFVVFAAGRYGLVIDRSGRVVWYRKFESGPGLNFMTEPTGRYVVRPPTPATNGALPWLEIDALGDVTRSYGCALGLQPRFHDLIDSGADGYWVLCDETRTMDLTAFGGLADARVTGTAVQHIGANGEVLFQWSAFDHLAITDLDPIDRAGSMVNWTHGNALDFAADGNLLVSFRALNEITKIDIATGRIIWRMGGRANQFTFLDTPAPAFARQHGVRMIAPSTLILLDNLGDPKESRAERYELDEAHHTARLLQSYGSVPAVVTEIGGSVQPLAGGRTLVSFGTAGRIEEFDAAGHRLWRIDGNPGYVFRAQWIRSLYAPGIGTSR